MFEEANRRQIYRQMIPHRYPVLVFLICLGFLRAHLDEYNSEKRTVKQYSQTLGVKVL
jgi:hypothetical protein